MAPTGGAKVRPFKVSCNGTTSWANNQHVGTGSMKHESRLEAKSELNSVVVNQQDLILYGFDQDFGRVFDFARNTTCIERSATLYTAHEANTPVVAVVVVVVVQPT